MLLASKLPFKEIIGVEFSEELVSIANSNILKYPKELILCRNIDIKCIDATEFIPPEQPLIIYFYNPFEEPVMKKVINNLSNSYLSNPREMIILYFNPVHSYLFDSAVCFNRKSRDEYLAIYHTQ